VIEVRTFTSVPPEPVLARAGDVYLDAYARPPHGEAAADREAFIDRVRRYARRDGFRLVLASSGEDAVGVGLGVVAYPGDWWRDRVAEQLEAREVQEWLGDACLEFVHLGVRSGYEGRGIGSAIHDAVLAGRPAPVAVLTVLRRAEAARRLYARRGWTVLRDAVTVGASEGVILMARRLP
jgi:hypothetical protein